MEEQKNASYYQKQLEEINQKLEEVSGRRQGLNKKLKEVEIKKEQAYQLPPSLEQLIEATKLEIEENNICRQLVNLEDYETRSHSIRRECNICLNSFSGRITHSQFVNAYSQERYQRTITRSEYDIKDYSYELKGNQLQIKLLGLLAEKGEITADEKNEKVKSLENDNELLVDGISFQEENIFKTRKEKIGRMLGFNLDSGLIDSATWRYQMSLLNQATSLSDSSEQEILSSKPNSDVTGKKK